MLRRLWSAISLSFRVLASELKDVFGLSASEPEDPTLAGTAEKAVAAVAVLGACLLALIPEHLVTKAIANTLFAVATQLWNGRNGQQFPQPH